MIENDDLALYMQSLKEQKKQRDKKRLEALLNKYGSKEGINQHGSLEETIEVLFSGGDKLLDEVIAEREAKVLEENEKNKTPILQEIMHMNNFDQDDEKEAYAQNVHKHTEKRNTENNSQNNIFLRKKDDPFDKNNFINIKMKKAIEENEGIILHPYVDTADKTTIGPGVNINVGSKRIEWWFQNSQTGKLQKLDNDNPEDAKLINKELSKLDKYKHDNHHTADFFLDKTNLRITEAHAHQLYLNRINLAINDVKDLIRTHNQHRSRKIANFEDLPEPLQIVLVDMVYNLGKDNFHWQKRLKKNGNGYVGYPNFWKAFENQNLDKMIFESKRHVKQSSLKKRNDFTQKLLEKLRI